MKLDEYTSFNKIMQRITNRMRKFQLRKLFWNPQALIQLRCALTNSLQQLLPINKVFQRY